MSEEEIPDLHENIEDEEESLPCLCSKKELWIPEIRGLLFSKNLRASCSTMINRRSSKNLVSKSRSVCPRGE